MQKSEPNDEVRTLMQRLTREGTLIVCFLMALYLTIALLSYSPEDPGFTTTGSNEDVANAVGVYGAWMSDTLLHVFGYLAFGFPFLLAYNVYSSFREEKLSAEFSWAMFGFKIVLKRKKCHRRRTGKHNEKQHKQKHKKLCKNIKNIHTIYNSKYFVDFCIYSLHLVWIP